MSRIERKEELKVAADKFRFFNYLLRTDRILHPSHISLMLPVLHSRHRIKGQPCAHKPCTCCKEPINEDYARRYRQAPSKQFRPVSRIGQTKYVIPRQYTLNAASRRQPQFQRESPARLID